MGDREDEVPESPATWENVVVGEAKEVVGRILRNDEMTKEGEEQVDLAHEVRDEYDDEHQG